MLCRRTIFYLCGSYACAVSCSLLLLIHEYAPVYTVSFFFLMIRRPPRSTLDRSSAASDVYKRQTYYWVGGAGVWSDYANHWATSSGGTTFQTSIPTITDDVIFDSNSFTAVSYTHLRAHETVLDLVCRLLLEKKKNNKTKKKKNVFIIHI